MTKENANEVNSEGTVLYSVIYIYALHVTMSAGFIRHYHCTLGGINVNVYACLC